MCTIGLAWRVFDDAPVVVGANREERWDRPAEGPQPIGNDRFAPIDREAGGTWIGVNAAGLFAAVTNRRGGPTGDRSRGLLLGDVLEREDVNTAEAYVEEALAEHTYAGFNLVIADETAATVFEWDGRRRLTHLDPGVHVIVNRGMHDVVAKGAVVRSRLLGWIDGDVSGFTNRLQTVLVDHGIGACLHRDTRGTRSSSIVVLRPEGRSSWHYANGPPCEASYRPVLEGEL